MGCCDGEQDSDRRALCRLDSTSPPRPTARMPEYDTDYCREDIPDHAISSAPGEPIEYRDDVLAALPPALQREAMIAWFTERFCDPAEELPYNGREGGFQFIYGGPYDPVDELYDRFGDIIDDAVVQSAVDHLHREVGDEWAPRNYEHDFDVTVDARDQPFANLARRLAEAGKVQALKGDPAAEQLVLHWAYGAVITALETYLWETLVFWLDEDDRVLQGIVTRFEAFSSRQLTLGDIFKRTAGLKQEVRGFLQKLVWHRWKDVAKLYEAAFGFKPPPFSAFESAILVRHDIVHRNSQNADGEPIPVTAAEIDALAVAVEVFATALEAQLPSLPLDFGDIGPEEF